MRKAFTLIELLIVLFLMAVMSGIAVLIIVGVHFLSKYW